MVERRSKYCTMYGRAYVDSKLVAEAEMMAAIVTKPEFTSSEQTIEKDS
jgi:3-hydroxymyristoyl/3-hydroxydecanoyl-(acyl carrier protein) dehydratase